MNALAVKVICVVVAFAAALAFAYNRGAADTAADYELRLQTQGKLAAEALAEAERDTRDAEKAGRDALYAQAAKYLEEENRAKSEIDSLRADVRRSAVRLSVAVASCSAPATGGDITTAAGSRAEARAELVPEVADDLVGIAADGDSAVRQLNRVIDAYDAMRAAYNELAEKVAALDRG